MNKHIQFIGIVGLVAFLFGLASYFLIEYDSLGFTKIHLILGGLLIAWFLFSFTLKGGIRQFGSVAVRRAAGFGFGVTLYSALFVGLVILANYLTVRHDPLHYDSTEQKVYTLAPQTLEVLERLEDPVIIRTFYLGGDVPPEVQELLNRLQRAGEKLRWESIDPEKNPAITEKLGISERGTLHFSFDREGSNREVKIVRDINEQEVINALLKLSRGGSKKIYYLTGHGEGDLGSATEDGYLFLKEAIQGENAVLEPLSLSSQGKVPDDAAALLVIAPSRPLLPGEMQAIQQYLAAGGRAVFASEPSTAEVLQPLAAELGIQIGKDIVLDQLLRLFAGPGIGFEPVIHQYAAHPATRNFKGESVFVTTSSVRKSEVPKHGTVTELAFTSEKSWAERNLELVLSSDPKAALDPEDLRGPVSVAAAYQGLPPAPGTTAPLEGESAEGAQENSADEQNEARLVVFGDADFVSNLYIRQLFNRDLFLNALNWVLGEEQGVTIRAKTLRASTKALTAQQFRNIFLFTALLLPELVLISGFGMWWFRKS